MNRLNQIIERFNHGFNKWRIWYREWNERQEAEKESIYREIDRKLYKESLRDKMKGGENNGNKMSKMPNPVRKGRRPIR